MLKCKESNVHNDLTFLEGIGLLELKESNNRCAGYYCSTDSVGHATVVGGGMGAMHESSIVFRCFDFCR